MLSFDYSMKLDIKGGSAGEHAFTLRCLPQETASQHIENMHIHVRPDVPLSYGTDAFGNRYCFGLIHRRHSLFEVSVSGNVEHYNGRFDMATQAQQMLYRQFTEKTMPGPALKKIYGELSGAQEPGDDVYHTALLIRDRIHSAMTYVPGATSPVTSADQAAACKKGVCQDYTHIMLVLCRMSGIACRYVAGLLLGEGQSHAWVEVCDGDRWIPMDPTNPTVGSDERLIFSYGRDAADCQINRGVYLGSGTQIQRVSANLQNE